MGKIRIIIYMLTMLIEIIGVTVIYTGILNNFGSTESFIIYGFGLVLIMIGIFLFYSTYSNKLEDIEMTEKERDEKNYRSSILTTVFEYIIYLVIISFFTYAFYSSWLDNDQVVNIVILIIFLLLFVIVSWNLIKTLKELKDNK